MSREQPSYYCIIPANVRYDNRLSAQEKLMYGEITALTQANGVCWASNAYFARLYDTTKRTVIRYINNLVEYGYIKNDVTFINGTNQVDKRHITLVTNVTPPSDKDVTTPRDNSDTTPSDKNVTYNNTSVNTTSKNNKDALFEKVWIAYNYKKSKANAKKSFSKITEEEFEKIKKHLPEYVKSTFTNGAFPPRLYLSTYLNQKRWEDEITQTAKESGTVLQAKPTGAFQ